MKQTPKQIVLSTFPGATSNLEMRFDPPGAMHPIFFWAVWALVRGKGLTIIGQGSTPQAAWKDARNNLPSLVA